jgi:hypothetical protein
MRARLVDEALGKAGRRGRGRGCVRQVMGNK